MSNRNSQAVVSNTSNGIAPQSSNAASTQIAAAPAVIAAGVIAKQVAKLAIKYGRRYLPTIGAGVAAGAGFGFAGLNPSDNTASDLAKAGAWQTYQKLNPKAAAQPGAQGVFNVSFSAGVNAGYAARNLVGSSLQNPTSTNVAIANELRGTLGTTAATSFSEAVASNNQGAEQSIAANNTSRGLRA
jgi:hypothetical protein